ncbi:sel1 repeat family protein [Streptomyces sp. NPDC007905]|uniref:tetratricopeptide repeat protein n=1 Tax=Streptomyces sp. NPDC007905 TaxID=3364788 RepID=UPI0036EF05FA
MGRTPNFFEDLRRVGALKRDRLGGHPADNALSKVPQPAVSRDTVGAWLRGERFPQQVESLLAVLREIRAEASRRGFLGTPADGFSGESVADLLAEDRWLRSWRAEQLRRTQSNQEGVERRQARRALEDEERRARQAALADRPRPVRSWTPKRLGVHPAIPGYPATPDGADFVLPVYVPRPHDDLLRTRLAAAVTDSASLLVVVRGESCTGKTRTAVEALKAVPDDFQLLFPADADSLLAMLAADALGPRTVLWLNEAQHYLGGPAGDAVAAALLRRLDADGPFIALATLWPDHDTALTTASASSQDGSHRQARALLAQAHYVHLPASFTEHLDSVRRAAGHDASLATALEAGGTDITQTLTAGPDLVAHYERPGGPHGVYGKALISAVMDAHRLGVTGPLPLAFLHDAAPGYLTRSERATADPDTWFTAALTHARTLIKQTIRPFQDAPRSSGIGALPGVVALADYLQQHGRRTRRLLCPPATFWNAATHHLTNPDDLTHLADAAHGRYRLRHAAHLYRAAADAGGSYALARLADMRKEAGDREEAERLYRAAVNAGNTFALKWLADMREEAGDQEGAERLARQAFDAGERYALTRLADMRERAGDQEGAERLAHEAADAGDTEALTRLAELREKAGDQEGAERLYRAATDAGDTLALTWLAQMREKAGDQAGAERIANEAASAGMTYPLTRLADMRKKAGDQAGAERLYRAAADAGDTDALTLLADMQEEAGDKEGAERIVRQALGAGELHALRWLTHMREKAGDREGAERLARQAADAGDTDVLTRLAELREKAGDQEGAERLARQAADAEDTDALTQLAELREVAGNPEEAERLYRAAVDAGDTFALMWLAARKNWRYGLEADGTAAGPWLWPEPRTAASDSPYGRTPRYLGLRVALRRALRTRHVAQPVPPCPRPPPAPSLTRPPGPKLTYELRPPATRAQDSIPIPPALAEDRCGREPQLRGGPGRSGRHSLRLRTASTAPASAAIPPPIIGTTCIDAL